MSARPWSLNNDITLTVSCGVLRASFVPSTVFTEPRHWCQRYPRFTKPGTQSQHLRG